MLTQIIPASSTDIIGKTIKRLIGVTIPNKLGGRGVAIIFTDNTFVVLSPFKGSGVIIIAEWDELLPYPISDNGDILNPGVDY